MRDFKYLLPKPEQGYRGTKGSFWFLIAMVRAGHGQEPDPHVRRRRRSQQHCRDHRRRRRRQQPDPSVRQWGLEQLILAIVAWVVIVRYRFLVPFVLLLQLFDWLMRGVMGEIKPLVVDSMPPGGIGNIIFVPLVAVALWFSLPKAGDRAAVATD